MKNILIERFEEFSNKLSKLVYNKSLWFIVALIMFFNGLMDLLVWEIFKFYVPCWVIAFMSFGFMMLAVFIKELLEEDKI